MHITLPLTTDESLALRRYAMREGVTEEAAAQSIIRDALIGLGELELPEADNDD